jgi:hypothetical protein
VGPRAGLDRCGKSRPTGIPSSDHPVRGQSYTLRYSVHHYNVWAEIFGICEHYVRFGGNLSLVTVVPELQTPADFHMRSERVTTAS